MNYELALKLKENGFPQPEYVKIADSLGIKSGNIGHIVGRSDNEEIVYYPTLSELIEACGHPIQISSGNHPNMQWRAENGVVIKYGNTPEQSVANLWLELNKRVDK